MKRFLILICLISCTLCVFSFENKKVAILEVADAEGKLSTSQKLMLRTNLSQVVSNTEGFEAYDRTHLDAIMEEHNFQRSGLVDNNQIRELGILAGVSFILLPEGAIADENNLYVTAQLLNVETGKVEFTASELVGVSAVKMKQGCEALAMKILDKLNISTKRSLMEEEAERAQFYINTHKGVYTYRGSEMDKNAYLNFLKNNCPEAYKQYKKGTKTIIGGWCMFGIGLACVAGGGVHYYLVDKNYKEIDQHKYWAYYTDEQKKSLSDKHDQYKTISYVVMGAGGAIMVTSIPILSVGYTMRKKSMQTYNKTCSSPNIPSLTFNLTAAPNGLGVAMNF